jgi:hypothetical protein
VSNAWLNAAWKAVLPSARKFVLVALADYANDAGECFPSVTMLMERCALSDRGVQQQLAGLVDTGFVRRDFRNGRSTVYVLTDPKTWTTPERASPHPRTTFTPEPGSPPNDVHPTPEQDSPPPPNDVHPTPERGSPITIIEPSVEPSGIHQLFPPTKSFDDFWREYPTKTAKPQCAAKWAKKGCDLLADRIVADVVAKKAGDRRWLDGYVPNPLTYLNQERWNDPIQPRQQAPPAKPSVSDSFHDKTYYGTPDDELPAFLRPSANAA